MRKRWSIWGAILLASIATLAMIVVRLIGMPSSSGPRIGLLLPATGRGAGIGAHVREGFELAEKTLRARQEGDGARLSFVYQDTESNPVAARRAFDVLVRRHRVRVIVGSVLSSDTKAFAAALDAARVPVLANGASAPELRGISRWFFRNWPADDVEGTAMARFARSTLKLGRGAVLAADDPYPRGLSAAFAQEFAALGGSIEKQDLYEPGLTNLDGSVRRVLRAKPEFLYAVGFPAELASIARTVHALDNKLPVLSGKALESPEFFEAAGDAGEGYFLTVPVVQEGSVEYLRFKQDYQASFGDAPEIGAAIAFDAAMLAGEACLATDCSRGSIRDWLAALRDYPGVSGWTTFDDLGDVKKPIAIKRIERGRAVVVADVATTASVAK